MASLQSPALSSSQGSDLGGRGRYGLELFWLSFLALFLELTVIRWAPAVVRLVAYYANLMLISSFLGLGVGVIVSKTKKSLFGRLPALLLVNVAFLLIAHFVTMPGTAVESRFYTPVPRVVRYLCLVGIFISNAIMFVPLGQRIGSLFEVLPPLHAYSWDLGGSLVGTLCFGLFSLRYFSPPLGIGLVSLMIILLLPRRRWLHAIPLLGLSMIGVFGSTNLKAFWSPYYYITVTQDGTRHKKPLREPVPGLRTMQDPPRYDVSVNHGFYQSDRSMDLRRYSPQKRPDVLSARMLYDLPYILAPVHQRVLILGSGGGTDTEVAVLNGAEQVDAVEIDPMLVKLSDRFNPSGIYEDSRVHVYVDDARAFLRRSKGGYDMVLFGLLDSQALFSSMTNIRLDGYIYTVQSMKSAYQLLNDHGVLSLIFMAGREWLARKLVRMVEDATGQMPVVYESQGRIVISAFRSQHPEPPQQYGQFVRTVFVAGDDLSDAVAPTDNWPFLYLSSKTIPPDYLIVIGILLVVTLPAVYLLRPDRGFGINDGHFLFLGLGFLLLETKSISDCSLYFGTTWFVTMVVVAGVLLMVLAANIVAMHLSGFRMWMYAPLIATLLLLYSVDRDSVLALTLNQRILWSLLVVPLPIFFAGLIFSTTFREESSPSSFLGANLIGAMIGGFCEYLSMKIGNGNLMFLVIGAYLVSLGFRMRLTRAGLAPTKCP
jgi:Spermine/spermidine synthase domain